MAIINVLLDIYSHIYIYVYTLIIIENIMNIMSGHIMKTVLYIKLNKGPK